MYNHDFPMSIELTLELGSYEEGRTLTILENDLILEGVIALPPTSSVAVMLEVKSLAISGDFAIPIVVLDQSGNLLLEGSILVEYRVAFELARVAVARSGGRIDVEVDLDVLEQLHDAEVIIHTSSSIRPLSSNRPPTDLSPGSFRFVSSYEFDESVIRNQPSADHYILAEVAARLSNGRPLRYRSEVIPLSHGSIDPEDSQTSRPALAWLPVSLGVAGCITLAVGAWAWRRRK